MKTDGEGCFSFTNVSGFEVVEASFTGYNDGNATPDVFTGDENDEVIIYLEKRSRFSLIKNKSKLGKLSILKTFCLIRASLT